MMMSTKKLVKIAKYWPKLGGLNGRKIISFRPSINNILSSSYDRYTTTTSSSFVVEKGHFVVYTRDDKRFVMPLAYLNDNILRELFRLSEQEFGLSNHGPITLPCDAAFMEYILKLIRRGVAKDLEMALIRSMNNNPTGCSSFISSSNFIEERFASQQILLLA